MNPEEFEQALQRDLASASRRDPTPAWKAEILARATAHPKEKVRIFPRPILLAWAACWAVALLLHFMTPANPADLVAQSRPQSARAVAAEWRALQTQRAAMMSLLAANDSTNSSRP